MVQILTYEQITFIELRNIAGQHIFDMTGEPSFNSRF